MWLIVACQESTSIVIASAVCNQNHPAASLRLHELNPVVPRTHHYLRRPTTIGSLCPSQRSYAWCQADEAARTTA